MAFPDNEQLGTKLGAAGIAYASYWGAPSRCERARPELARAEGAEAVIRRLRCRQ